CHRLHLDALEEILLYPQGKLYPLSKFEFGIAGHAARSLLPRSGTPTAWQLLETLRERLKRVRVLCKSCKLRF
ncbi:MAG: hypothetical protein V7K18_07280, partial [Nostoc sp.]|uniref:hypothetical protein n=1 Tax=Nostoc sp. TaxID=1180 RepID=UPI002FF8A4BD